MDEIIKIDQALEDFNILLKGITKQLKMKQKNKEKYKSIIRMNLDLLEFFKR